MSTIFMLSMMAWSLKRLFCASSGVERLIGVTSFSFCSLIRTQTQCGGEGEGESRRSTARAGGGSSMSAGSGG
jgi:hypothetical protein